MFIHTLRYWLSLKLENLRILHFCNALRKNTKKYQIFRIGPRLYTRLFPVGNCLIVVLEQSSLN